MNKIRISSQDLGYLRLLFEIFDETKEELETNVAVQNANSGNSKNLAGKSTITPKKEWAS